MAELVVEIHVPLTRPPARAADDYLYPWIDDIDGYLASLDGSDGEEYDSGEELGDEYLFFVAAATEPQLIELARTVSQLPGVPDGVYVTVNDSEGEMDRRIDLSNGRSRDAVRSDSTLDRSQVERTPSSDLGEDHSRFATHFTDPPYRDASDNFAPFGTDEGADILARAAQNPPAL